MDEFDLDVCVAEHKPVGCFLSYLSALFGAGVEACV